MHTIPPIYQMLPDPFFGAPDWIRHIIFGFFWGFIIATFLWNKLDQHIKDK